jgi:hypothetical protein
MGVWPQGRIVSFVDFDWATAPDHEMHILATVYSKREHLAQRKFDAWCAQGPSIDRVVFCPARNGINDIVRRGCRDKNVDFVRSKDLFTTVDEEGVLPCANAFSVSDGKVRRCVCELSFGGTNQRECVKAYGQQLPARVLQRWLLTLFCHPLIPLLPRNSRGPTRERRGRTSHRVA